jgi:hypothetical protein
MLLTSFAFLAINLKKTFETMLAKVLSENFGDFLFFLSNFSKNKKMIYAKNLQKAKTRIFVLTLIQKNNFKSLRER